MEQKKKTTTEPGNKKEEEKEEKKHKIWKLIAALLIIIIILIILWLLLRGKTTTTGQFPENIKSSALQCTSDSASYASKIGEISADSRETKITSVFYDGDAINSITLDHTMIFPSVNAASSAEAVVHSNFGFALSASGYENGKFDNKFTILDNKLVVSVHGKKSDWNDFNKDYFMIKSEVLPTTLDGLRKEYESQGFSCKIIE